VSLRCDGVAGIDNRELGVLECSIQVLVTVLSTSCASLRLLQDLTWPEFEAVARHTRILSARAQTVIFSEAAPGNWTALVVSGAVDILKPDASRRNRLPATIRPGQLLGEMASVDGQTRSATAVATKDTMLLALTKSAFDRLLEENPPLVVKLLPGLMRLLVLRLRRTNLQLVDRLTD
jgi:CRP/FNR family transcriptional regulator, cyclic AMP receptor protein